MKYEKDSLIHKKHQWEKAESDRFLFTRRLQEKIFELTVENNALQTSLREKETQVHELKMALVEAQLASEKCQPKESGDRLVSHSEDNGEQL